MLTKITATQGSTMFEQLFDSYSDAIEKQDSLEDQGWQTILTSLDMDFEEYGILALEDCVDQLELHYPPTDAEYH